MESVNAISGNKTHGTLGSDRLACWALAPGRLARAIPAVFAGNFETDTTIKVWVRRAQAAVALTAPITIVGLHVMDGLLVGDPFGGALAFFTWCLLLWSTASVVVRSRDKDRTALLRATLAKHPDAGATALGTFLHGSARLLLVTIWFLFILARTMLFMTNPLVGPVWGSLAFFPFSVGLLGFVDTMWTTDQWVDASCRAVRGFGDEVIASLGVDSNNRRRALTRRSSVFNTRECARTFAEDVELGGAVKVFERARFEDSVDVAHGVVETMNEILSGPITSFLAAMIIAECSLFYFASRSEGSEAGIFVAPAVCIPFMIIWVLKWLSSVGDVYVKVISELMSPSIFLRLSVALEREIPGLSEAARHALDRSSMGFAVYNVTMTTEKVIYIVGSVVFGVLVSYEWGGSSTASTVVATGPCHHIILNNDTQSATSVDL